MSIDKQQILAIARKQIAAQIDVKVESLDKLYQSKVEAGSAPKLSASFELSSRQSVSVALQGARLTRLEQVKSEGAQWLCGQVQIDATARARLAAQVTSAPGAAIDPATEELLLAKFREKAARAARP
ncbi:MAG: hypothetical protein V4582_13585 [Pseudomonadota bacterium]